MQRSALRNLPARAFAIGAAVSTAAIFFGATPTYAVPTVQASSAPTPEPTRIPRGTLVLPLGSSLFFVLDDRLSSKVNRTGDTVRAHLKDALELNGTLIAPAGAPMLIKIADVHGAKSGDEDGTLDIYFQPLTLANGASLPLHTPTSHLSIHMSAGQASTAGITDTLKDIFIPYHYLYRAIRKGAELELGAGTLLRARTGATIDASRAGVVSIIAPPPVSTSIDTPHADYKPMPLATVPAKAPPLTGAVGDKPPTPLPHTTPPV
ncbi:MAG: hypothetical protein GIW97_08695 [Candidatus Eremiobacteraeota bacterium]|nr:hypothetical protein [Candidatus Eremiobacteraeota bacterium]